MDHLTESEIQSKLKALGKEGSNCLSWIQPDTDSAHHRITYPHMQYLDKGNKYNCDKLADEWFSWLYRTPSAISPFANAGSAYGGLMMMDERNSFVLRDEGMQVYFAAVSPFQTPDVKSITMTEQSPLLVPIYTMSASRQDHPSLDEAKLLELVINDLKGINCKELVATFDGDPVSGCVVIRKNPLKISGIPKDNVIGIPENRLKRPGNYIETYHGGLWLLIREESLKSGDHLLKFTVLSKNYEIDAKLLISVLA